jgi:hypothetical protein
MCTLRNGKKAGMYVENKRKHGGKNIMKRNLFSREKSGSKSKSCKSSSKAYLTI